MKKYTIFLSLMSLVVGLVLSTSSVVAEENGTAGNVDANTSATVKTNADKREGSNRPLLKPVPVKMLNADAKVELSAEAKLKMETDRKALTDEMKKERELFRQRVETERKAFTDKLKTEREAFKAKVKTEREEFKSVNADKKKEFWNKVGVVVGQRFTVAIEHLEKAQVRVGEVIAKLDAEGKDTADIKADLDLSKQKLTEAKAKLAEIRAVLPASGEKITPEIFEKIKVLAREARDSLKESVESLRNAIKKIKNLVAEKRTVEATTEVESNTEAGVQ